MLKFKETLKKGQILFQKGIAKAMHWVAYSDRDSTNTVD